MAFAVVGNICVENTAKSATIKAISLKFVKVVKNEEGSGKGKSAAERDRRPMFRVFDAEK